MIEVSYLPPEYAHLIYFETFGERGFGSVDADLFISGGGKLSLGALIYPTITAGGLFPSLSAQ